MKHKIKFDAAGGFKAIYSDEIADMVRECGPSTITRGSHVEPTPNGQWTAAMIGGPTLGPFLTRQEALNAEVLWLWNHI